MALHRVLVLGGYGFFGSRLVERLSRRPDLHVIVAGRSSTRGLALAQALRQSAASEVSSETVDTERSDLAGRLRSLAPHVVICASGPFQGQQYHVARACIAAGVHYIDLADAREFVVGVGALDREAVAAGVTVISGASSVPALSTAVADHLTRGLTRTDRIDIGISPGNRTERGLSTVQAILSYCGKPLPASAATPAFGWSGSRRHLYPAPVGSRLLSPCDVPDLALLPERYVGRPSVRFGAGLELALLHRGMNVMAMLTRLGIVSNWSDHAVPLKAAADWFKTLGSDAGAMHVTVAGETAPGSKRTRTWHLVAQSGDGPYVPTLAASALIRKMQRGEAPPAGAGPCVGMLTIEDLAHETEGLDIQMTELSA